MARITPTGLVPVTLPEYKAQLESNYASVDGATFDLSSNSPDAQLIVSFAQGYYELDQLQIQTDINRDPSRAEDAALDAAHVAILIARLDTFCNARRRGT